MAGRAPNGPLDNISGSDRDKVTAAAAQELLTRQLAAIKKTRKPK